MEKFGEINLSTLRGTLALLSVPCIPAALLPGFLFPLLRVLGAAMGLGLGPGWGWAGAETGRRLGWAGAVPGLGLSWGWNWVELGLQQGRGWGWS